MKTNLKTITSKKLFVAIAIVAAASPTRSALAQITYEPYAINTYAGLAGNLGANDGTGSAARFFNPADVALDRSGNVYVADESNHKIRKIAPGAVVTTFAGSGAFGSADGTGAAAQFNDPQGIAVDSAGNLYVGDTVNNTVRKITPGAVVTTLAGLAGAAGSTDGIGSSARFNLPVGLAVDSAGNVYVADYNNSTIRKITPGGVVTTFAGSAGMSGTTDGIGGAARFFAPTDVAVDNADNLYVADKGNHTIRRITTPGAAVTTIAGTPGFGGFMDGTGAGAQFGHPLGVAADSAHNVYVADAGNAAIRKITPGGAVTTLAGNGMVGSNDGVGSAARFNTPSGLAVSSTGQIFIADTGNNTIRAGGGPLALVKAASRKVHGPAGTFDVPLPLTGSAGVECRTGGANDSHTLVVSFNNTLVSGNAAVIAGSGSVTGSPTFSGDEMTVNLTGISNAQTVTVRLSNVTDSFSQVLPDTNINIAFLLGDTSANRSVNASDVSQTKARSGQLVDATNFRNDVTVNGSINASDVTLVKARSGTALP